MMVSMKGDGGDELLTRDDVARMLGLSAHTLACWRSAGRGPAIVKFGAGRSAAVRYRRRDIEQWIADPLRTEAEAGEPWRAARRAAAAATRSAADDKPSGRRRRSARRRPSRAR